MNTQLSTSVSGSEAALRLDSIEDAIEAIRQRKPVVVVDDEDRENEGDLIFAANAATPELLGFTIRHSSGVICVGMSEKNLERLHLPQMTMVNEDRKGTAYTVTVDARDGITTGISAADRAHTIRMLGDSATEPWELTRPGHVFPLRAMPGGVLQRPGHTEAAMDLAELAGFSAAGALCEIVHDDGSMMRAPALRAFADEHGLLMVSIADLIAYRRRTEKQVERVAVTSLPTVHGDFQAYGYRNIIDASEHFAVVVGEIGDGQDILVRVHSECLTGDTFGSLRCDCGPQLSAALDRVQTEGRGIVLYMRGHEGRGIGLLSKLKAYEQQDLGADTIEANQRLGLPVDARDYGTGAQILADLGVRTMRLLTNNPVKRASIEGYGLEVLSSEPLVIAPNAHNERYLRTKRERMGHQLPDPEQAQPLAHQEQE